MPGDLRDNLGALLLASCSCREKEMDFYRDEVCDDLVASGAGVDSVFVHPGGLF